MVSVNLYMGQKYFVAIDSTAQQDSLAFDHYERSKSVDGSDRDRKFPDPVFRFLELYYGGLRRGSYPDFAALLLFPASTGNVDQSVKI